MKGFLLNMMHFLLWKLFWDSLRYKIYTKVIIIGYLSWFLDSYIGYFPKVIFIKPYTVTLLTLHVFVFASVGALRLRNVPGKRDFSLQNLVT